MSRGIVKSKEPGPVREDLRCPLCGQPNANAFLLSINHGDTQGREQCMSQYLMGNHIRFYLRRLREAPVMGTKQATVVSMRKQLVEEMAVARTYKVDVDAILAEFPAENCRHCIDGDHDGCEEDTMWSDVVEGSADCGCWKAGHAEAS